MKHTFSDHSKWKHSIIQIDNDLHSEARTAYRAFWTESLDSSTRCPVIGYCSGGSWPTIRQAALEAWRLYPDEEIYGPSGRKLKK